MENRDLEREIVAQPRAFVRRKDMTAVRTIAGNERYELSVHLMEAEEAELDLLEVILEGSTHEGEHVYATAEASITGDHHVITRAYTRALLLVKATGSRVLALVVGDEEPQQQLVAFAQQDKVTLSRRRRAGAFLHAPLASFTPT
ncbi:hypothetical protein [Ferrimicrobium sp.]|uniref:hypothetical protein n=1 Tax=Ferrimicrobium sp. TaxID=2926050 RepID=UPI0026238AE6|nr:hypothetical protein [Ferrimicrobium sp.]